MPPTLAGVDPRRAGLDSVSPRAREQEPDLGQ
jgi:hypothetical protein